MSSKTILIGLGAVGKNPSMKTFLGARSYDCSSQNTEDFAAWCKLVSKECRFNDRAVECEVVRFTKQFFCFGQSQSTPY